jgi:oxygen-independent coproporphyrinogen III oxidase
VFGYAHVPWMKPHQKLIPESTLPDGPMRLDMAEAIAVRLADAGFVRIGLDHYARPDDPLAGAAISGRLRRDFQGYSDVATDATIGLGASAISNLSSGLAQNHVSVRAYETAVADRRFATARGVSRSGEDRLRAEVIESLLCEFAVDLAAVTLVHGGDLKSFSGLVPALDAMAADGLIRRSDTKIEITPEGRPWARVVAALFDRYLPDGAAARHSRAV